MNKMTPAQSPLSSLRPHLSIFGEAVFGLTIYSVIPYNRVGEWIEAADATSGWDEKRPAKISAVYVNRS